MRIVLSLLLLACSASAAYAAERQTNPSVSQKSSLAAPTNLRVLMGSSACNKIGLLGDARWTASSVPIYAQTQNSNLPPEPTGQIDCASAFQTTYALAQWDWDPASCASSQNAHCIPTEGWWLLRSAPGQAAYQVNVVEASPDLKAAGPRVAVLWRKGLPPCVVVIAGADAQIQDSFGGPILVPRLKSAPSNQACTMPQIKLR